MVVHRYGGWFNAWKDQWNENHGSGSQTAIQNIIDLYFQKIVISLLTPNFDLK